VETLDNEYKILKKDKERQIDNLINSKSSNVKEFEIKFEDLRSR